MDISFVRTFIDSIPTAEVLKVCRYHGLDEPEADDEVDQTHEEQEPVALVHDYCVDYPSVINCIEVAYSFSVEYDTVAGLLEKTRGFITSATLYEVLETAENYRSNDIVSVDINKLLNKEETRDFIPVPVNGWFVLTDSEPESNPGHQYSTQICIKQTDMRFARILSGSKFTRRGLHDIRISIKRTEIEDAATVEIDTKLLIYRPNETRSTANSNFMSSMFGGGNATSMDVTVLDRGEPDGDGVCTEEGCCH